MKTILSASKSVTEDTIHVIQELEVEQLKENTVFQYPELSKNDQWLEDRIIDTVFDRIRDSNNPHQVIAISAVVSRLTRPTMILISYDVKRNEGERQMKEKKAWDSWIEYRKRNPTMTPQEEDEIMEEMGVFEEFAEEVCGIPKDVEK